VDFNDKHAEVSRPRADMEAWLPSPSIIHSSCAMAAMIVFIGSAVLPGVAPKAWGLSQDGTLYTSVQSPDDGAWSAWTT
jgi:hypothetical protein